MNLESQYLAIQYKKYFHRQLRLNKNQNHVQGDHLLD